MLKKILAAIIVLSLFLATVQTSYAVGNDCILYVSADGSADGDGSENNPFDSITAAQQRIRELISENNQRNITVYVREGIYSVLNRLYFDENYSVADGYTLTFKGYNDENAVFVSGISLDSEKAQLLTDKTILKRLPNEAKGKVWVYDINETGLTREDYGEMEYRGPYSSENPAVPKNPKAAILSYNGERMTIARYPNKGFLRVEEIIRSCPASFSSEKDYNSGIVLPFPDVRCSRWGTAKDAVIFGTLYYDWGACSADIKSIDVRQRQIESKQAFRYGIREYNVEKGGGKYYVYNLLEEIDAPGEYYIDRDENKLYFYPADDNPKEADITLGYEMYIIYGNNVRNITFENLQFEGARDSAVRFENSDNILFNKCQIKNSSSAVTFAGGHNCGVINSVICDINSGISLGSTDEQREFLEETGHYAINNHIYNWGIVDHRYSSAARMNGVGNIFAKNKVHGAEHQAIQPNGINNVVEYNEFYDTNSEVADSGCLYEGQNYAKRGNVYRYNYFHDIGPENNEFFVNAIYEDDFQSGTTLYGNIFKNASNGIFLNGGMDSQIFNNIFVDCNSTFRWDMAEWNAYIPMVGGEKYNITMGIAKDNEMWRKVFPEFFTIQFSSADFFTYVRGNKGYDNVSINTKDSDFRENCLVNSSAEPSLKLSDGGAGFVDYKNNNFALNPNSAILKAYPDFRYDFENIGYEEDGLSLDEIEKYKSHMIKIDTNLLPIRDRLQKDSVQKKIIVVKGDAAIYFADGKYKLYSVDREIAPIYKDGRLVIPADCAEALGMIITQNDDLINVALGSKNIDFDYEYLDEDIVIPLRECFEKLGYNVIWNESENIIIYDKQFSISDEIIERYVQKIK